MFPPQVPRGLHPTHQGHGHLRDHSSLPGRLQRGREAGDGARRCHRPCGDRDRHAEPPEPPRRGICGPGAAHTTCGAPLRPGAAPHRLAKGPFKYIFSSPRVLESFLPTETLCKGKNKNAKNGENQSPTFPLLSQERANTCRSISATTLNFSRVTTL